MKAKWVQHFRLVSLQVSCIALVLTAGKWMLDPQAGQRQVKEFTFPQHLEIPDWRLISSHTIDHPPTKYDRVMSGRRYIYQHLNQKVAIDLRYLINTNGAVLNFHPGNLTTRSKRFIQTQQYQTAQGFYVLSIDPKQMNLDSCVNPHGSATVSSKQFWQHRYREDLQISRLLPWILGQTSLLDTRCIWIHVSIARTNQSPTETHESLQQIWSSLVVQWQSHFPDD